MSLWRAGVLLGDVTSLVYSLLGGELTVRFIAAEDALYDAIEDTAQQLDLID